jgi:hypothetical protein
MGEVDIKNTIEQFFKEGLARGYALGREGATGNHPPECHIEWRGLQPVIHIARPSISIASPAQIGLINGKKKH